MHDLKQEIGILIEKLYALQAGPGSAEARVLADLTKIAAEVEAVSDPRRISSGFAELNLFWVNDVPWCSELSKDLEKLMIMYAELLEAAGR